MGYREQPWSRAALAVPKPVPNLSQGTEPGESRAARTKGCNHSSTRAQLRKSLLLALPGALPLPEHGAGGAEPCQV